MRKLIIIALFLVLGCATTPESERTITRIIEFPGMSKTQLYNKTLSFMAQRITHITKGEITHRDPVEGTVAGMMIFQSSLGFGTTNIPTSIEVNTKDGRVRLIFIPQSIYNTDGLGRKGMEITHFDSLNYGLAVKNADYWVGEYTTFVRNQGKRSKDNW